MNLTWIVPFTLIFIFLSNGTNAQNEATGGWLFLTHKQKISNKMNLLADFQVRSFDKFAYVSTLLLRPGLSYQFNKKHAAAVGYAYKGDWEKQDGKKSYDFENRIYEQYLLAMETNKTEWTIRFRLEQRFTEQKEDSKFSQRSRVLAGTQIPLAADKEFKKGLYFNLQNEIFLNVENKENINGHVFDQNRLYGGIGYRWSKSFEIEGGYIYWRQRESDKYVNTNVVQIMATTEW